MFKQKTSYDMRISDWSSDVCSSDLLLKAERSMVQKSGYFARSAPANPGDLRLIQSMVDLAVESALNAVSGVTGHDEDQAGRLRTIRSEQRSVGQECVSTCRSGWSNHH